MPIKLDAAKIAEFELAIQAMADFRQTFGRDKRKWIVPMKTAWEEKRRNEESRYRQTFCGQSY